eukprot:TRINITY_DN11660_c0_g1_i2.p1 TRINITY_DN11660_c0_g1~~TRINITY_DN11660_c0_g1_i2.p1  ORF type:complete len:519 (-),score=136.54 TRINITY_DN11660_c0_g1_i2:133-1689(-)
MSSKSRMPWLQKKLNGINWHGNKLSILVVPPPKGGGERSGPGTSGAAAISTIENNIHARYNNHEKFLNLGDIQTNMQAKLDFNNDHCVHALLQMLQRKCGDVQSIIFRNNHIKKLSGFADLTQYLPLVRNLDFAHNHVADFRELDHLANLNLTELLFEGNPIAKSGEGASSKYHLEVGRRFPALSFLDGEPFQSLIRFDAPKSLSKTTLPPIQDSFCQNAAVVQLVEGFVANFFRAFDEEKDTLLEVYIASSLFSLSCSNMSSKPSFGKSKDKSKKPKSLEKFEAMNRNLMRMSDLQKREQMIHKGKAEIVTAFKQFPETKHSAEGLTIDVTNLAYGPEERLVVTIHGHFWDNEAKVNRSYDRTLIVCRGGPADLVVLNDMLHVREFLDKIDPTPQGMTSSGCGDDDEGRETSTFVSSTTDRRGGVSSSTSSSGFSSSSMGTAGASTSSYGSESFSSLGPTGVIHDPIQRLAFATMMKEQYARECYENNGGDYDRAWSDFLQMQAAGELPPHVFQSYF